MSFYRVKEWVYFLALPFLGYFSVTKELHKATIFLLFGVSISYLAWGYSLNAVFDRAYKRKSYSRAQFFKEIILSFIVLLPALGLLSFFPFNKNEIFKILFLGVLSGYLYSGWPTRFKSMPLLDLFFNSSCFAFLYLVGIAAVKIIDYEAFLLFLFIFIMIIPIQVGHEISHYKEDRSENIGNTICFFGLDKANIILTASCLVFIAYSIYMSKAMKLGVLFLSLGLIFCVYVCVISLNGIKKQKTDHLKKKILLASSAYVVLTFLMFFNRT